MYATLQQFKSYLNITDSSQDTLLQIFLNSAGSIINNYCWVDSFALGDYEELIPVKGIYDNEYGLYFFVKNKPVNTVKELNNSVYEGIKGTDYLVINQRELIFKKLPNPPMGQLQIKYNAWFQAIPDELQLVEMIIASWLRQQHGKENVTSYKLGDEQIVFGSRTTSWEDGDVAYFRVKTYLDSLKCFNLPV